MKLRLVVTLVATAALALGAASSFGAKSVKSTVEITEGGPDLFQGGVDSPKKACEKGRLVSLYYEPGKGMGQLIDTDMTNRKGEWSISGSFIAGMYHAEVRARRIKYEDITIQCGFAKGITARFRGSP